MSRPRTDCSILEPFRDQIGKVPDVVIAKRAGVLPRLVRTYRDQLGLPAYQRGGDDGFRVRDVPEHEP